jgi:hypothetical protein
MPERVQQRTDDGEERRVAFLEIVAATAILAIVVVVLFMVFTYRPV